MTADNWAQHDCWWCERDRLQAENEQLKGELIWWKGLADLVTQYEHDVATGNFPGISLEQMLVNNIKHPMQS